MGLRDNQFEDDYRSGSHNILNDFFRPGLRGANRYWRAVGYFSSSALESFGAPLSEFIRSGGSIRLITSVELMKQDIDAIEQGLGRLEVCEKRIEQTIDDQFSGGVSDGVAALATLLKIGRLEIRIAVPKRGYGIYHEKVGVFLDQSDYVAFSGSSNESRQAFEANYECIDVYPSWKAADRALRKLRHFEELWENKDPGADTYEFPAAAKEKLIRACVREPGIAQPVGRYVVVSWDHQQKALEQFVRHERGVLNMATGTGKTRTALNILEYLSSKQKIDTVIVTTDGNDLLDQWYGQMVTLATTLPERFRVYRHYRDHKDISDFLLNPTKGVLLCSRLSVDLALKRLSPGLAKRTLLVHDEVHGLGSPSNQERLVGLSDKIRFRLGLSATPEREYDEVGNHFVEQHIGPVIYEFELKDAIERGILTSFNYYPLEYVLTEEDRQRLANVYKRRSACEAAGTPMSEKEVWMEISKVYKTSRTKLPVFAEFITRHPELLQRSIVFVETQEYGEEVLEIIHQVHPNFHTYFSGEDSETLKRFARGDLECLLTCHRLSEGIDVQSLSTVVLFSSDRARLETIQRMGRCLRRDPKMPSKIANIIDFIRKRDEGKEPTVDEVRCEWLTGLSKARPKEVTNGT